MDIRDLLSSSAEKLAENETNFSKKEIKEMLEAKQALQNSAAILSKTEKKFTVKKGGYTEQELKDMLIIQSRTEEDVEHELNGKLIDICEKMKEQFKISRIPTSMVVGVANEIFVQIERGNIVNVAELEKNPTVIKVAQKFCEKQQLVENFSATMQGKEPIHQIDNQVEGTNYIASSAEVARAFENLNKITESDKKIYTLFNNFTEESFEKDREEARKIWQSEEREKEYEQRISNLKNIYLNGTDEEKGFALTLAITNEVIETRARMTPEEQEKAKLQANGVLFGFLQSLNISMVNSERIVNEMGNFFLRDGAFSREENIELRDRLSRIDSKDKSSLESFILDVMEKKSLECGKTFDKNAIQKMLKNSGTGEIRRETFISKQLMAKTMARMVLPKEKSKQYADMMTALAKPGSTIDMEFVDEIGEYDKELYLETLRVMNESYKMNNNKSGQDAVEQMLEGAEEGLVWKKILDDKIKIRREKKPVEQRENKSELNAILYAFMRTAKNRTENVETIKNEFLGFLDSETGIEIDEKTELFEKIKATKSKEAFSEVLLDTIEERYLREGINFDRKRIVDVMQRKRNPKGNLLGKYRASARAQVRLDKVRYERYTILAENLRNPNYSEEYDLELVNEIKEIDELLYKDLLNNIKEALKIKNDEKLSEFYKENSVDEMGKKEPRPISVKKVKMETMVENMSEGTDSLMRASKKIQTSTEDIDR